MEAEDAGPMWPVYRALHADEKAKVDQIKDLGTEFWRACDAGPPTREMALAKTKIEEAVMWAVKSVTG